MRKFQLLSVALLMLFGVQLAKAEVVSPYVMTFDDVTISAWDFQSIAPCWKHVFQSDEDTYFHQNYSMKVIEGTDKGLYIDTDSKRDAYGDMAYINDNMIITPEVSGTVTLKYKADYASTSSILFIYKYVNGKKGEQVVNIEKPANTDWNTITIATDASNECFAIHGCRVLLNDFSATSADITLKPGIKVSKITSPTKNMSVDANDKGEYTFAYVVTLENNGDLDLSNTDLAGKNIYVVNAATNDTVATSSLATLLPDGIQKGASVSNLNIPVTLTIAKYPEAAKYNLQENISNTTFEGYTITPVPYTPVLAVYNGKTVLNDKDSFNMGKINTPTNGVITLSNEGAAALNITSMTVSGNYTISQKAPLVIPAHGTVELTITSTAVVLGSQTGKLTLASDGGNIELNLVSEVLDPDKWFVNFEDNKIPADMLNGDINGKNAGYVASCGTASSKYWFKADQSSVEITSPLLEVKEGDILSFDFKGSYPSSSVTISYSPDRMNWTEVEKIDKNNKMTVSGGTYSYDNICEISVSGIPAGKYYVKFHKIYYGFLDNICGFKKANPAIDFMLNDIDIPAEATVNNTYTAKVKLYNMLDKMVDADSYTATLYVDSVAVATAETKALKEKGSDLFEFAYTPHVAGSVKAFVEFVAGDYKIASPESEIVIAAEQANSTIQICEKTGTGRSPFNVYDKNSESELIYTEAQLAGKIAVDQKISKLIFKGTDNGTKSVTISLNVWMGATTDTKPVANNTTPIVTDGLTQVFSSDAYTCAHGTDVNIMEITLAEPYVYTGGNLKIMMKTSWSTYSTSLSMHVTDVADQAVIRHSDNSLSTTSSISCDTKLPVLYLGVETEPIAISGKVTDKAGSVALADVDVVLKSGDVEYYGTTDSEGNYTIQVIQSSLDYEATFSKEGYNEMTAPVSFGAGSVTKDVEMTSNGTAIDAVEMKMPVDDGRIYTILGQLVRSNGDITGLPKGIYIRNGKKFVVR